MYHIKIIWSSKTDLRDRASVEKINKNSMHGNYLNMILNLKINIFKDVKNVDI